MRVNMDRVSAMGELGATAMGQNTIIGNMVIDIMSMVILLLAKRIQVAMLKRAARRA